MEAGAKTATGAGGTTAGAAGGEATTTVGAVSAGGFAPWSKQQPLSVYHDLKLAGQVRENNKYVQSINQSINQSKRKTSYANG